MMSTIRTIDLSRLEVVTVQQITNVDAARVDEAIMGRTHRGYAHEETEAYDVRPLHTEFGLILPPGYKP